MKKKVLRFTLLFVSLGLLLFSASQAFAGGKTESKTTGKEAPAAAAAQAKESPMLTELVKAGRLPPLSERLPEEPFVAEPVEEVGQYGGTLRTAYTRAMLGGVIGVALYEPVLFVRRDGRTIYANAAKSWEMSSDGKILTLYLRKGMKWSDGQPFTAADFLFWYNDWLLNDELTPVKPKFWQRGGQMMKMEKVDDYAIRLVFAEPYPVVPMRLAFSWGNQNNFYAPAHYLKQFHIKHNSKANELAQKENFDHWWKLFQAKRNWTRVTGVPLISAWIPKTMSTTEVKLERNPYYFKVDTAGNQLPYIDNAHMVILSNLEVLKLKIMAGEIDFEGWSTFLEDYPLYMENREKGDYRVLRWDDAGSADVVFWPNLTHEDPVMREIIQDKRFRHALSLGINRNEINDVVYLGLGKAIQTTATLPGTEYYEEEFASAYAEYDFARANSLLDEMGLSKRGAEGFRLRPDGKTLSITIEVVPLEGPKVPVSEMVAKYWNEIGIKTSVKSSDRSLFDKRVDNNKHDVAVWHIGWAGQLMGTVEPRFMVPISVRARWGTEYYRWYVSDGEQGIEPPAVVKKLFQLYETMQITLDQKERIEAGKEIGRIQAEYLWGIGTVALAPRPIIVKNNLRNVSEKGMWAWDWFMNRIDEPSQMFFKK